MRQQDARITEKGREGRLTIHIGELVLEGIPASACRRIQDSIESQLAIELSRRGISQFGSSERHIARIDAGSFYLQRDASPEAVGQKIAGSILRALEPAEEEDGGAKENPET